MVIRRTDERNNPLESWAVRCRGSVWMSFADPIWAGGHATAQTGRTHDCIRTETKSSKSHLNPAGRPHMTQTRCRRVRSSSIFEGEPWCGRHLSCRMHGISSGQLYTWRKKFRSCALTGFMPVPMASSMAALPATAAASVEVPAEQSAAGLVEVELPNGIKLRITGDVGANTLRRILLALS